MIRTVGPVEVGERRLGGAVGGVFTPTRVLGTALGRTWGDGLQARLPGSAVPPATYSVIGISALLAATTHAPVMAGMRVFERTLDADLLFPLIIASVPAGYISAALRARSVYGASLGNSRPLQPWMMQVRQLRQVPIAVVCLDGSPVAATAAVAPADTRIVWVIHRDGRCRVIRLGEHATAIRRRSGRDSPCRMAGAAFG